MYYYYTNLIAILVIIIEIKAIEYRDIIFNLI